MKKNLLNYALVLCAGAVTLFSCQKQTAIKLDKETLKHEAVAHLQDDEKLPACKYDGKLEIIKQASDAETGEQLNALFTAYYFGKENKGVTPEDQLKNEAADYCARYKSTVEPLLKDIKGEVPENLNYSLEKEGKVEDQEGNLLIYSVSEKKFEGGAHSSFVQHFYNIDLRTKTLIKLADIFKPEYKEALNTAIVTNLMKDKGFKTEEEMQAAGYAPKAEITAKENFLLKSDKIVFYFNEYEIGAYSLGKTMVEVPYEEIKVLLKDPEVLKALRKL